jgi:5-formaminoimidazole-4-carboxamide-1-beta-D-ribofuranosyl 5'-monophosphate synthetase
MNKDQIEIDGIKYTKTDSIKDLKLAQSVKGMKYVLIRTYSAGVFVGYLKSKKDAEVVLLNARRLWYWDGASSLSQLAMEGVKKPENCKFPMEVSEVTLLNVIEVIQVTEKAKKSISEVGVWKQ